MITFALFLSPYTLYVNLSTGPTVRLSDSRGHYHAEIY